ncbi:MAG: hypothetical protein OES09_14855 [Gammaproteobacteria bacterium]|nr:hypothetical protein [Gammaproteobacteria bacterium]
MTRGLALANEDIRYEHRLYLASCGDLVVFIQALPHDLRYPLIIGHNPGLDELLEFICG